MTKISMLLLLAGLAGALQGQTLAFLDHNSGDLRLSFGEDGRAPQIWPALTTARHLAVDDDGGIWVPVPQGATVLRLNPDNGAVTAYPVGDQPVVVAAAGPDEAFVGVAGPGSTNFSLRHVGPAGVETLAVLPERPVLLLADRDQGVWAVLATGPQPATLVHLDANGVFDFQAPLGIFPRVLRLTPDGSVWVLNTVPADLRKFSLSGGLQVSVSVPSSTRDVIVGAHGHLILARENEGIIELRDENGGSALPIDIGGFPHSLALDGRERLWVADTVNASLSRFAHANHDLPDLVLTGGSGGSVGLNQARDAALGSGYHDDPDGDGVPTRVELDWRFDPFDGTDLPAELSLLTPLIPGQTSGLRLRAPACPGRMVWFGVSRQSAPFGSGGYGSSLVADDVFAWFQSDGAPAIVPTVFSMMPGSGELVQSITLPAIPELSGIGLAIGALILQENFSFEEALATPAIEVVIS